MFYLRRIDKFAGYLIIRVANITPDAQEHNKSIAAQSAIVLLLILQGKVQRECASRTLRHALYD